MLVALNNFISHTRLVFKLRHPVSGETQHSHTTAIIIEDSEEFWLEMRCRHHDCQGMIRKRIPPDLVREWQAEESPD
jgi:hypothetical protein